MAKKKTEPVGYEPHPLAERFPLMGPAEFERLKADISEHGLENSIAIFEGKILDGRNRYRALVELGKPLDGYLVAWDGTKEEAEAFVDSQNLHRRHLNQADQERLRAERVERVAEARREGKSLPAIAQAEGVSLGQVQRDLAKASGLSGDKPEPKTGTVQGADGKQYKAKKPRKPKVEKAEVLVIPPTPVERQGAASVGHQTTGRTPEAQPDPEAPPAPVKPEDEGKPEKSAPAKGTIKKAPDVDGWGVPVQPHAIEAFLAVPRFKELLWHLRQARRLFNEIASAEGGQFLQCKDVSAFRRDGAGENGEDVGKFVSHALEQAFLQIENAQPAHTACPWRFVDGPHPEECATCLGLNWTPALGNNIPPAAVARIKEKYSV